MRGWKIPFSIDRSDRRSLVEQLKDGLREAIVLVAGPKHVRGETF